MIRWYQVAASVACALAAPAAPGRGNVERFTWPSEPRPGITIESRADSFDGVPITVSEFVFSDVRIRTDSPGIWIGANGPHGRYSLTMRHVQNPSITFSITWFGPGEFLPDIESASWSAYLEGLRQIHGTRLLDIVEGGNTGGGDGIFLFGKPYREVVYSISPDGEERSVARRELFLFLRGKLIAFVVEASPDQVVALTASVDRFLSRLELVE